MSGALLPLSRRLCSSILQKHESFFAAVSLNASDPIRLFSSDTDNKESTSRHSSSSPSGKQTGEQGSSSKKLSRDQRNKSWDASSPPPREDRHKSESPSFPSTLEEFPNRGQQMNLGFPISANFVETIKRARNMSFEDIERVAGLEKDSNSDPTSSRDDFLVLAELIEAYLSLVPTPKPQIDGLDTHHRAHLHALVTILRHRYGTNGREKAMPPEMAIDSPLTTRVVNTAPIGRLPWEVLNVDESRGVVHWAVDLTAGKASNPWQNSKLSHETKSLIYSLHKEDPTNKYSVENLSKIFKIRQQRVMAIIALKELAEKRTFKDKEEEVAAENFRKLVEDDLYQCNEVFGANERHIVNLPSYPNYATIHAEALLNKLEDVLQKPRDEIQPEEITPEIARQVTGVKPIAALEEEIANKEEDMLVNEFKKSLEYNLGKVGTGLIRKKGRHTAPMRPKAGWSLVVTPLKSTRRGGDKEKEKESKPVPYVAMPDGEQRELNEDEALLVERKTPLPRRRIM